MQDIWSFQKNYDVAETEQRVTSRYFSIITDQVRLLYKWYDLPFKDHMSIWTTVYFSIVHPPGMNIHHAKPYRRL